MFINDVCKLTGLTKKAIEYYEKQGLLYPEIIENGYRKYDSKAITTLKEVSLLRKMGVGVSDIKVILSSGNKLDALTACKNKMARQINMLNKQQECLTHLIDSGYNIENSFQYVCQQLDENCVIKERLAEAFPGNYGLFLSFHFGRFLNEKIDSPEKEAAYCKIINFLDGLTDMPFPKEVEDYMIEAGVQWNEETEQSLDVGIKAAVEDYDNFMQTKRNIIEMYLDYCKSDEYKSSVGYKMKMLMVNFQKQSGYYEVFIENMKILSSEYKIYLEKLNQANDIFLQEYPEAADILGYF